MQIVWFFLEINKILVFLKKMNNKYKICVFIKNVMI